MLPNYSMALIQRWVLSFSALYDIALQILNGNMPLIFRNLGKERIEKKRTRMGEILTEKNALSKMFFVQQTFRKERAC